ncbi:Centromere/kinetochore Zw10-domain-containing protein [Cladochytrium replicatum]|nr:Centromere/kinetochore Zw10-domain-containing protein [Cladochytrium replicatum]
MPSSQQYPSQAELESRLESARGNVLAMLNSFYSEFITTSQWVLDIYPQLERLEIDLKRSLKDGQKWAIDASSRLKELIILVQLHRSLQGYDSTALHSLREAILHVKSFNYYFGRTEDFESATFVNVRQVLKNEVIIRRANMKHRASQLFATACTISQTHPSTVDLRVSYNIGAIGGLPSLEVSVSLSDIIEAAHDLDILSNRAQSFFSQLKRLVIEPMIKGDGWSITATNSKVRPKSDGAGMNRNGKVATQIQVGKKSNLRGELRVSFGKAGTFVSNEIHLKTSLENIVTISRFLNESLFAAIRRITPLHPESDESDGNAEVENKKEQITECVRRLWYDSFMPIVVEDVLKPMIPDTFTSEIMGKQHIIWFAEQLSALGVVSKFENELEKVLSNMARLVVRKRRTTLLQTAREILMSDDQNTAEVTEATERGGINAFRSGKNGADKTKLGAGNDGKTGKENKEGLDITEHDQFRLPTCQITVRTQLLMEMAYQTMQEASSSADESSAMELYLCTRDIFALFRGVVPVHEADKLETDPVRAMLFYNDCIYIVYHLLTLGYVATTAKGNKFPKGAAVDEKSEASLITFIDMVPAFRTLAERYFTNAMRTSRDHLVQLLVPNRSFDRSTLFTGLSDDERFADAERCVKQATYRLQTLARSWKAILPSDVYIETIGLLSGTLVSSLMKETAQAFAFLQLQEQNDSGGRASAILGEERSQLRYLLSLVKRVVQDLFERRNENGRATTSAMSLSNVGKSKGIWIKVSPGPHVEQWEEFCNTIQELEKE